MAVYFVIHALQTVSQVWSLPIWAEILLTCVWEVLQLSITFLVGYLFKLSAFNPYLDSEAHLATTEVRVPMLATEVQLGWSDESFLNVSEDGVSSNLAPWDASTAVPPPPAPPAVIEVFTTSTRGGRGPRRRRMGPASPAAHGVRVTAGVPVTAGAEVELGPLPENGASARGDQPQIV